MQKERAAISRNAAPHLKPRFKRRERAPETKDFDDHSVHQGGNVQRREPRQAPREQCAEDDPGDVDRMNRQNTGRHRSVPSWRHAHNSLEANRRSLLRTSIVKLRSERVPLSRLSLGVPLAQRVVQSVLMGYLPAYVDINLNHLFQFVFSFSARAPGCSRPTTN